MGGAQDWYDCLGNKVPPYRRAQARRQLRMMNERVDDEWSTEQEDEFLDKVCSHIRWDEPDMAITVAAEELTLSGAYRLLGSLCAGPKTPPKDEVHPYEKLVEAYDA